VSGDEERLRLGTADSKRLAVLKQVVELAAVRTKRLLEIEQSLERGLDLADALADGDATSRAFLQIPRAR